MNNHHTHAFGYSIPPSFSGGYCPPYRIPFVPPPLNYSTNPLNNASGGDTDADKIRRDCGNGRQYEPPNPQMMESISHMHAYISNLTESIHYLVNRVNNIEHYIASSSSAAAAAGHNSSLLAPNPSSSAMIPPPVTTLHQTGDEGATTYTAPLPPNTNRMQRTIL
jgi:hypothetical protein